MYHNGMAQLNYHHLRYFWMVAREGSIARACTQLHLTQPTISGQLRSLERAAARSSSTGSDATWSFRTLGELFTATRTTFFPLGGNCKMR